MKKLLFALTLCCFFATAGNAQDDEMMKKWMEMATPNQNHKKLEGFVGSWDAVVRMWMGPQASTSQGKAEMKMILDGRYLAQEFTSTMGNGMTMHGMGMMGYDNMNSKYFSTWIDNMGTGMYMSEGKMEKDQFVMQGKMDDPMTGEKGKATKEVWQMVDNDKLIFEMYMMENGKEMKTMEITYIRKK